MLTLREGVAFDRSLSRLGHGKGYYDKFLSSYVSSGRHRPLLGTAFTLWFTVDSLSFIWIPSCVIFPRTAACSLAGAYG
jgi:hypothetical protein